MTDKPLMTMDQALVVLDRMKHWRVQCENSEGNRRHSCTIWNGGKRVTAVRRGPPLNAVVGALAKLREEKKRPRKSEESDAAPALGIVG